MSKQPGYIAHTKDLERGCLGKEPTCNAGDPRFNPWVGKIRWRRDRLPTAVFLGFPWWLSWKRIRLQCGRPGFDIPGLGRSPGEGKGCPLQYSGLENSVDCMGSQRVRHDCATFTLLPFSQRFKCFTQSMLRQSFRLCIQASWCCLRPFSKTESLFPRLCLLA